MKNKKLIDADILSKEILIGCNQEIIKYKTMRRALGNVARKALDCVETAPAVDAVPVVRCKDCKEYKRWDGKPICIRLGSWYGDTNPDDFCSYGRRKDAEGE